MSQGSLYTGERSGFPEQKSGAVRTIESEHSYVHEGCAFYCCHEVLSLANNGIHQVEFTVPSSIEMHLKDFTYFVTGVPLLFELYQTPSLTTGSSALTARNRHRGRTDDSLVVLKSNPTSVVLTNAKKLISTYIGGGTGSGATKSGGTRDNSLEWLLEADVYLLRITNLSGSAQTVAIELNWYELLE